MAMPPERSRPLHNFTLSGPLRWGNQRFLRCKKVEDNNNNNNNDDDDNAANVASAVVNRRSECRPGKEVIVGERSPGFEDSSKKPNPIVGSEEDDEIEAVREKLMLDLRVAADRMKVSIFEERERGGGGGGEVVAVSGGGDSPNLPPRPCNLRTRRAACNEPNWNSPAKSSRLRGLAAAVATAPERGESSIPTRPKFSVSLTREEIESDFLAMTGKKPARRPKKRPKAVQRQLDSLFPGTWLTEVTPETYKVPDVPESGKTSR